MGDIIIGRKVEQEILRQRIESKSPEFIAIYGRRRVGKTYLIRQYFNDTFSFYFTGYSAAHLFICKCLNVTKVSRKMLTTYSLCKMLRSRTNTISYSVRFLMKLRCTGRLLKHWQTRHPD